MTDAELTNTLVVGEYISRAIMREREAWSIRQALVYQPVKQIVKMTPKLRGSRVVAWIVDYHYDPGGEPE